MKILLGINHPAHVHFFKNFIWIMTGRGHDVRISARRKEDTLDLLDSYRFKYTEMVGHRSGIIGKILTFFVRWFQTYKLCRIQKPDIMIGIAEFYYAQISNLFRSKSLIFTDTEHVQIDPYLTFPFADKILTPSCYHKRIGMKQVTYDGYHELAYLHPKYYKPNKQTVEGVGIPTDRKYVVLRFVSWGASHDIGQQGLSDKNMIQLVEELSRYCNIYISSEGDLPNSLRQYRLNVSPELMHDVLAYADLFIGEGATMASECAMLGTPAIYVNPLAVGYCDQLEAKYGLIFNFRNFSGVLDKAKNILRTEGFREDQRPRHEKMLSDKIDVTQFMVDYVEEYAAMLRQ